MFYFLLKPYKKPTEANYQHAAILFAEGLQALNKPFTANIDYFPDPSGNYLFRQGTVDKTTQYIVTSHPEEFKDLLLLQQLQQHKLIIFDSKDEWVRSSSTALSHLSYRYFMTTAKVITDKVKPLCFGATNRMVAASASASTATASALATADKWQDRKEAIFWAHRVDNHQIRNYVKNYYTRSNTPLHIHLDNFEPAVVAVEATAVAALHYWQHTGRRHSPAYFNALQEYKCMDAHGGYPTREGSINQWDSWKVWEGLLAGMLVITADLDYYKIKLPFPLLPYQHYIPIRYDHIEDGYNALNRLSDEKKAAIAKAGQEFALKNFTPKSMAKYIMDNLV
jgi:hypothetical protein